MVGGEKRTVLMVGGSNGIVRDGWRAREGGRWEKKK
jgi:hypothetical protein